VPFIQVLEDKGEDELTLEKLQRFWRHPVRAFFQLRLGINFWLEETDLPDAEPFTLDSLERFQMNLQLLNALVAGDDAQQLFRRYRAAGSLPYGAFGEIVWEDQLAEMQELSAKVIAERQNGTSVEVDLTLSGTRLVGWLSDVQNDGLLRWRPSVLNVAHGMSLWVEHVVWCAIGGEGSSRMYGRKASEWNFPALDSEQAKGYLQQLIDGYRKGMCQPLLLLPNSGGAWIKACYDPANDVILWDEQTQLKAKNKLLAAWEGNQMVAGEGADVWLQRLYRTLDNDYYEAVISEAERYLLPLFRFNGSK
jgi:exodeoxyribonuclease V gamma subunit